MTLIEWLLIGVIAAMVLCTLLIGRLLAELRADLLSAIQRMILK